MPQPWTIFVFPIAWLGHAFFCTVLLNLAYGRPWPRKLLRRLRWTVAAIVLSFPILPWLLSTIELPPGNFPESAIFAYLQVCIFIGGIIVPIFTIERLVGRVPRSVKSRSSVVVDYGEKPSLIGGGPHHSLAKLPGNQLLQVEFTQWEVELAELPPAWDGLTILHLSDLHFHGTPAREFHEEVVKKCLTDGFDIVAITGDIVDSMWHHRWIVPILGKLTKSAYAVAILGNHDYWYDPVRIRKRLRRAGFVVVGNGWTETTIRGEPLVVVGNEAPWFPPPSDLDGCVSIPFRLGLSHTPDQIDWAVRHHVQLLLAGHVHGGQVRLPILGPLFVPSRYSRRFDSGFFEVDGTLMHVSRGLAGREPLRWNCRPEVTRIVLRRKH